MHELPLPEVAGKGLARHMKYERLAAESHTNAHCWVFALGEVLAAIRRSPPTLKASAVRPSALATSLSAYVAAMFVALGPCSASATEVIECPSVMAHEPVRDAHPGWRVHSSGPARLSGAHIMFVVQSHYEGLLDPASQVRLKDEDQTTLVTFDLASNRRKAPFTLMCLYGEHARLDRVLPRDVRSCQVVHRKYFRETEGQGAYTVTCR